MLKVRVATADIPGVPVGRWSPPAERTRDARRAPRSGAQEHRMPTETTRDTVFLVKGNREHCFLFDGDDPLELYRAITRQMSKPEAGISREDAVEVLEGIVPERLRAI